MQSALKPERTRSLELLHVRKHMTTSMIAALHSSTVSGGTLAKSLYFSPVKSHTRAHAFQVLDYIRIAELLR